MWEIEIIANKRKWIVHTTDNFEVGNRIGLKWNVEDIHVMWKEIEE